MSREKSNWAKDLSETTDAYYKNKTPIDEPLFKREVLQPVYEKFVQEYGARSAETFYNYLLRLNQLK